MPRRPASSFALALAIGGVLLLAPIAESGIWDPHELERAELARRIAVELFGARSLALDADPEGLPTLTDLGAGELAFTSMALGFRLFGQHDWAGRLPLAVWALAGAVALYLFLRRLLGPRAGLYGVVALVTMPLYFVQARTMLGDAVTLAAAAIAFVGLAGAVLDARSARAQLGWLLCGAAGLVAGFLARGVLVGVAAPALGVGLGWSTLALGGGAEPDADAAARARARAAGIAALVVGVAALGWGALVLARQAGDTERVVRALGFAATGRAAVESTFDLVVRDLGHALFPWSALLPFVLGRLLRASPRARGLGAVLLAGCATAYAVHAWLAPHAGGLAFSATAVLAAAVAVVADDFEHGAPPSPELAWGTVLIGVVLWRDFAAAPAKLLAPYALGDRLLPRRFEPPSLTTFALGAGVMCVVTALAWLDRPRAYERRGRPWLQARAWVRGRALAARRALGALAAAYGGNLVFGALVVEAALCGLGATLLIGEHYGWANVVRLPSLVRRIGGHAWWTLPLALALAPLALDGARLSFSVLCALARLPRAGGALAGALVGGALLGLGFHPALGRALSPREAFETFERVRAPGEPLGLLGLSARAARYYASGAELVELGHVRAALGWLHEPGAPRRFLLLRARDLAELNALHRERSGENLPVLDARSSEILLAASDLGRVPSRSPLAPLVGAALPAAVQHPVRAVLDERLEALGWEVRDARGALVDHVVPGRAYVMRFFYRVIAPLGRDYTAFLHLDGKGRRHNGDHEPLEGRYDTRLWRAGDVISDPYELTLEPNFSPGDYTVYYGFFSGAERLPVSKGRHHDDRIVGGVLRVR
jgi:hypothetical protein